MPLQGGRVGLGLAHGRAWHETAELGPGGKPLQTRRHAPRGTFATVQDGRRLARSLEVLDEASGATAQPAKAALVCPHHLLRRSAW